VSRHPFDPVSAVFGILGILAGLLVAVGHTGDLDRTGSWWLAVAAALAGLAILPWRRRSGSSANNTTGSVGEP